MSSVNSIAGLLSNKYASRGLNFKDSLYAWRSAGINPELIREHVYADINEKINSIDARIIYKLAHDIQSTGDLDKEDKYGVFEKLKAMSSVRLTPSIKTALERTGENTYRCKFAADISWKIEMRDGVAWLKRISGPQELLGAECDDSKKKKSDVTSITKTASEIEEVDVVDTKKGNPELEPESKEYDFNNPEASHNFWAKNAMGGLDGMVVTMDQPQMQPPIQSQGQPPMIPMMQDSDSMLNGALLQCLMCEREAMEQSLALWYKQPPEFDMKWRTDTEKRHKDVVTKIDQLMDVAK